MTPQERELIAGLFQRLNAASAGPIDEEARAFIQQLATAQPLAPYLLVQTALVQEHALAGAQSRIAALEAELAGRNAVDAPKPAARSFLSGLAGAGTEGRAAAPGPDAASPARLGPWGAAAAARPAPPETAPTAPMGRMGMGAAGGPSFLQTALTTAAGVAGGALLFQGIQSLLGHAGSPFAGPAAAAAPPVENVFITDDRGSSQPEPATIAGSDANDALDDPAQPDDLTQADLDDSDQSFDSSDFDSGDDGTIL